MVRLCVFEDKSYEIRLSNITKMEKTRVLKQQMTSNIAHELRTPTTCLRNFTRKSKHLGRATQHLCGKGIQTVRTIDAID